MSKINSSKAENNNKEEKVMVLVASNNKGKIKEVKEILEGYDVISLKESGVNIDPETEQSEVFEGVIRGRLPEKQYGENGFGFDAIFELEGRHDTMASISAEEKNGISPRKIALSKLNEFLKTNL